MVDQSEFSQDELKDGQFPHQIFLFNLIGNHVLLILIALSNSSYLEVTAVPVALSLAIFSYILIMAPAKVKSESEFVRSHWALALKRTKVFLITYAVLFAAGVTAWLAYSYGGVMKEQAMALAGGLGILPTMVVVLVLCILETDALHQALNGSVPRTFSDRLGEGSPESKD